MRPAELTCQHGVGHSAEIHGCDGCCSVMVKTVKMTRDELRAKLEAELFDIWLRSDLDDWTNHKMRDLHILYHSLFEDED